MLLGDILGFGNVLRQIIELYLGALDRFGLLVFLALSFGPGIELPRSAADGAGAMGEEVILVRAFGAGLTQEQRANVLAVDGAVAGFLAACEMGERGQKIDRGRDLVADAAGLDLAWPAGDA